MGVGESPGKMLTSPMLKGLWNRAWRGGDPLRVALGNLEREVMEIVWQCGAGTVKDVQSRLPRVVAYTTVMTTLDRLYKKGLLARTPEGRAFRYRPAQSEDEFKRSQVAEGLKMLFSTERRVAPVSFLVEEITKHDEQLLDELERAIEEKRRQLKRSKH